MPKLFQLLALAAVVAIAASTPVSHLFKDDKVDMALEDLEVLAVALKKETSAQLQIPLAGKPAAAPPGSQPPVKISAADHPGCCPSGKYGPSSSQCTSCGTAMMPMKSSGSMYSNGECRNTKITDCSKTAGVNGSERDSIPCLRGQYGPDSSQCQDCISGQTSDVGYNSKNTDCFQCNTCQTLSGRECKPKCPTATVPGKPACSLTPTKDKNNNRVAGGVCYTA